MTRKHDIQHESPGERDPTHATQPPPPSPSMPNPNEPPEPHARRTGNVQSPVPLQLPSS
ncbi:protein of unknown function [Streptantibioticus cattleyicolor NRRL 8057 = DSM 46488]|nr:protein of unknown function [Streptantibioticus cattleyicolor NRRL 8057 = DSM 46488]